MQMAGDVARVIVRGQRIVLPVEREPPVRDAVAEAADTGAEVRRIGQPPGQGIVAERDVGGDALAVRHCEAHEDRTVFGDAGRHALGVGEREDLRFTAIVQFPVDGGF